MHAVTKMANIRQNRQIRRADFRFDEIDKNWSKSSNP